ncbi:MAG: HAD-IA family hydrolase [Anaerolineae bacterium]|jgi:HAD superfamily hydrolase (TIGR01662 family)|nr:HAD-IA family hydrolase [Anaerolineae bacterium]MBT3714336.1 HAD-IA family hydrolase [Anaerolineae bacterium]MBT4310674.1 HAD-IA family hydrolase [Anaerolineae bacterium]MBT4457024.1 HAD-IA family hydrolase [Anaerolineae bacterium]MBT4841490.1 HAD-IA family hydrolase [Anaerolineae bacterium]
MIKAILFDFSQTLVDSAEGFRLAEKQAETKIFNDLGLKPWSDFMTDYRRLRKDFHAKANFSRKALWEAIYQNYKQEPNENLISSEENNYWETIIANTKIFPETKEVLAQLSLKYRLALITNNHRQKKSGRYRISRFPDLESLFEVIIVAGENDIPPKPDPKPFLTCLENLEIKASEAVYVGDDFKNDILGAKAVGIKPVWLKHHSISRNWHSMETTVLTITSLKALLDLV